MRKFRTALASALLVGASLAASAMAAAPPAPTADDIAHFDAFVREFKSEAVANGIRPQIYDRAMAGIALNTAVQQHNLEQAEYVRPIWQYLASAVSEERVRLGRDARAANKAVLARLQKTYGIAPQYLAAFWGLETGYGRNIGTYNLFEALATLAYQGPRAEYGRKQLLAALKIANTEPLDPKAMVASWAGAVGETQFAPTTFLEHAVDGDGDGKKDLWNSPADALASTAHYLNGLGWHANESWGQQVTLPKDFPYAEADWELKKPVSVWRKLGVRDMGGKPIAGGDEPAAVFLPAGYRGPAFLLRANFEIILKYNFATSYALAIGLLADRLKGMPPIKASWPDNTHVLDQQSRMALQQALIALGYDTAGTDGVFGRRTRAALREYQKARGLVADGFPTPEILTRVLNERPPPS